MPELELLVTCEHGGNAVPDEYRPLFPESAKVVLDSHRGFDAGALTVARALAAGLGAPLLFSETTRLLVDLNRSLRHPRLWSEFTRGLAAADKRRLLETHYAPYRAAVEAAVRAALDRGTLLLHVSSHSFAPILDGATRNADVALLFDPARRSESEWAHRWRGSLACRFPEWKIRRNYPYRGTADGLTTHLRRLFPDPRYAGIELEINHRQVLDPCWPMHVDGIVASLAALADRR